MSPEPLPEEPPPLLGSWPRVYGVVLLLEAAVLLAIAIFSRWPYR
jgi:hypothetical protein